MTCTVCGGPIKSKRNTSGVCHGTAECRKEAGRIANRKHYRTHKEEAAQEWAAYSVGYKERRAELDRQRLQDPAIRARRQAAVQDFKTRPENADRVREYNRSGRRRYLARADRPCKFAADGCSEMARVGVKFCPEHHRAESKRQYNARRSGLMQRLATRQRMICPWCAESLPADTSLIQVDHIIPRASGLIIDEEWNYQALHRACNLAKSDAITPQAVALAADYGISLAA